MDIKERLLLIRIVTEIHKLPEYAVKSGIEDHSFKKSTNTNERQKIQVSKI